MNDQKQLIKAITDLTKAVNKNTEAIRENSKLNELDINTIESGTPDDLNRFLGKAYQPENGVLNEYYTWKDEWERIEREKQLNR